jgi:hypothetical protein
MVIVPRKVCAAAPGQKSHHQVARLQTQAPRPRLLRMTLQVVQAMTQLRSRRCYSHPLLQQAVGDPMKQKEKETGRRRHEDGRTVSDSSRELRKGKLVSIPKPAPETSSAAIASVTTGAGEEGATTLISIYLPLLDTHFHRSIWRLPTSPRSESQVVPPILHARLAFRDLGTRPWAWDLSHCLEISVFPHPNGLLAFSTE